MLSVEALIQAQGKQWNRAFAGNDYFSLIFQDSEVLIIFLKCDFAAMASFVVYVCKKIFMRRHSCAMTKYNLSSPSDANRKMKQNRNIYKHIYKDRNL